MVNWIVCSMLLASLALPLAAQVRFKYKCISKGRYTKKSNNGPRHYCWEGTYYSESTVPSHVKEFFNLSASERNAAYTGSRGSQTGSAVEASRKPEPVPIDAGMMRTIEVGAEYSVVLEKLGEPHGKLTNAGEDGTLEVWTYVLRNGAFAKVRLGAAKVVSVSIPE